MLRENAVESEWSVHFISIFLLAGIVTCRMEGEESWLSLDSIAACSSKHQMYRLSHKEVLFKGVLTAIPVSILQISV